MRTLKQVEKLDDEKSMTHSVRLKNRLFKRVFRYMVSRNIKGSSDGLRDVMEEALIELLDKRGVE